MPYIIQDKRKTFDQHIEIVDLNWGTLFNYDPGVGNYIITKLIHERLGTNFNYADLNEVIGMLECVKQELYRKVAADYEDTKERINGKI